MTSDFLAGSTGANAVMIRKILGQLKAAEPADVVKGTGGASISRPLVARAYTGAGVLYLLERKVRKAAVYMTQEERRIYLIKYLLGEISEYSGVDIPGDREGQERLLRGLMNLRPPVPADGSFLAVQDAYLAQCREERGITDADSITPMRGRLCLWQGDITTLRVGAIVNAANSGMTGCYVPLHRCIDNCIHTYAGVQLRILCGKMMREQGYPEPTGRAKLTPAFNLPCGYVLHTVGPMIGCCVTDEDRELLASCYRSCMSLAADNGIGSVAFCCISTGEFCFPNEEAAEIAIATVEECLENGTRLQKVIFNVFKERDRKIYERLLG